jgi:hypothetical protein
VKAYFFSLPADKLRAVMDAYEAAFGRAKREYAEQTMANWRSGKTQMSGLVASRLYNLLPPRMPLEHKYDLVRSLWQHVCPTTHKVMRVGPDEDEGTISDAVREHMLATVKKYFINDGIVTRFKWLSAGDAQVQQQLLNHLLQVEMEAANAALRVQLPVLLSHLREEGSNTKRLAQFIEIGKHKLELVFDRQSSGIKLEEPASTGVLASGSSQFGWVWLVIAVVTVAVLALISGHR